MSWVTTTAVLDRVNAGTAYGTMVQAMLDATEDWIERYCDRAYLVKPYTTTTQGITETFSGDGSSVYLAREYPFTAADVISLTINGETISARTSWDGDGWVIDPSMNGALVLCGYYYTEGVQNGELVYNPGYTTGTTGDFPYALLEAETEIACAIFNKRGLEGWKSGSVGEISWTLDQILNHDEAHDALNLINPFRKL